MSPDSLTYPLPPGDFGLPWLGETLQFFRDPDFSAKRHDRHGPIFKTRLFGQPTIFLKSPEANRFIFSHDNNYFAITWPDSVAKLLGPLSLALQTGHAHKQRRKLMAQAFQSRALASYLTHMDAIAQDYANRWARQGELTWYPELRNYTLDVACKLLVGLDRGSKTPLGEHFETWCAGLFTLPVDLPWTRFGKAMRCRQLLIDEIGNIVRDRQQQQNPGNDALGLMLQARDEEGNVLDPDELRDQVLLLLFAGHETLTSAIASFCRLIAQHPDVWDKLQAEQDRCGREEPLTDDRLKAMTYLDWTLQEVLRLVPPVGGGFRKTIASCSYNNYAIPAGWTVLYQINRTHADPDLYAEPDRFNPDRWNPDLAPANNRPFSYLPFGGGVRECLGKEFARLEMRVFAARLLREFEWDLLPNQDLRLVTIPTPRPRDNLKVSFKRKSNRS